MKKIIALSIILLGSLAGNAQSTDQDDMTNKYDTQKGDFSAAVLFGRGNFFESNLGTPPAPPLEGEWTVPGSAPRADFISANSNSFANMVGIKGRYFLESNIALKASFGAIIRDTPSRVNAESQSDFSGDVNNQILIPNYAAVKENNQVDLNLNIGGEYHFDSRFDRVSPYGGLDIPFYYARRSMYDPSVITVDNTPEVVDVGNRHTELIGTGAQVVAGLDFTLLEGLYIGIETKPVSYIYAYSTKSPGPGLENLEANTNTISFFVQNFLKLGMRF